MQNELAVISIIWVRFVLFLNFLKLLSHPVTATVCHLSVSTPSALLGSKPTGTEPCPDWADTLPMDIDMIPDLSAVPASKSLPDDFVPEVSDSHPRDDSPCVDDKPVETVGGDQTESHQVCEMGMAMSIQHI